MEINKKTTIIAYLDRVVINTLSGENYPTNYFDMRINFPVLKALKEYSPERIILFANRTIIHSGTKINNREFWGKITFIKSGVSNYMRLSRKDIKIEALYSIAHDWILGLDSESENFLSAISEFNNDKTLFIGPDDLTGKDFCENNNIEFITVKNFLNNYGN